MRMTASWSGPYGPTEYKVVARARSCPDSELPSDASSRPQQTVPPCSGLSRRGLETIERAAKAERRPTLTAPARAGVQYMWVGAKKRDSKSNKETGIKEGSRECCEIGA